ncbi:MAG: hypothetical protein IT349_15305 [Candidatus Eisenbacteria bacterium]|nr:hypothetical protein [Candidatus Eisenbacteria bacterium]MCC7143464.1 hypothetical protein [Candidatus Eisenbacteria bacterium]
MTSARFGFAIRPTAAALPALALSLLLHPVDLLAGTVTVRVLDGRDGAPLSGAYVQVGAAPGSPFAGNFGLTGADGRIVFSHPSLDALETVTVAAGGFARQSLIDAVTDSITVRLSREIPSSGVYGPSAEVSGTVTNIAVTNNDGNFDLSFVYPAVRLTDLLRERNLPIDVPADTVNFPVVGPTVLPGNVVMPSQTEFLFFTFSKPNYHFFIRDNAIYDFVALAGRLPIDALSAPPEEILNLLTTREVGVDRQIAVSGDRTLTINSDLNLTQNLTVNVPEAPNGTTLQVASVADLPSPQGLRTLFFDSKGGLADTQDSFLLSGRNPTGDLSDALPYIAGTYADSSWADLFSAGRVDRSALSLPATRTLGDFFMLPDLAQAGPSYQWSDVARPGFTPDPTWSLGAFRLEPATAADSTVATRALWEVWTAADAGSLILPTLDPSAPGGLPDVGQSPENDQIVWDHLLADPTGAIQEVLDASLTTASRFSRRKIAVTPVTTSVPGAVRPELAFRVGPNPIVGPLVVHWATPPRPGSDVVWSVTDAAGRRVEQGRFLASGEATDRLGRLDRLAGGVYWLRLSTEGETGLARLVVGLR